MKRRWLAAYANTYIEITCAIRKTRRWICTKEVNTGTNLPQRRSRLYSVDGDEYKFTLYR